MTDILWVVIFYAFLNNYLLAQDNQVDNFEEKAIEYFCKKIDSIIPGIEISEIRFSGKTKAAPSSVFNIADCIGEINQMKDSIPNKIFLDSLDHVLKTYKYPEKKIGRKCFKSTNRLFDVFNKSIYTLNLYNSIKYKESIYVELYLTNKKLEEYIVVLRFTYPAKNNISHFVKSRIY